MTAPSPRRGKPRRRKPAAATRGAGPDLWRKVQVPPDPEPITPSPRPSAVLTSLGAPPLTGQGAAAEHYIATVIERAAAVAVALAASADLLTAPGDGDDGGE